MVPSADHAGREGLVEVAENIVGNDDAPQVVRSVAAAQNMRTLKAQWSPFYD